MFAQARPKRPRTGSSAARSLAGSRRLAMTASIHLGTGAGPDTLPPLTAAEARRQQDVPLASRAAGSRAVRA